MNEDLGPPYEPDDPFRAAARRHQSTFRARILGVGYDEYGNMLRDEDARALLNYYPGLGVRSVLRARYPAYSRSRDANMLRSEHIPFNLFGPFVDSPELASSVVSGLARRTVRPPLVLRFEWAPSPRGSYLDDRTAFDVYIQGRGERDRIIGVGVEVKYTEQAYRIGKSEKKRVEDPASPYRRLTGAADDFATRDPGLLAANDLRQIWRNHLLGLAMRSRGEINDFVSVVLYPEGNRHFREAVHRYREMLGPAHREGVQGWTHERFIEAINGEGEITEWRQYLASRYPVPASGNMTAGRE